MQLFQVIMSGEVIAELTHFHAVSLAHDLNTEGVGFINNRIIFRKGYVRLKRK